MASQLKTITAVIMIDFSATPSATYQVVNSYKLYDPANPALGGDQAIPPRAVTATELSGPLSAFINNLVTAAKTNSGIT